MAYQIGGSGVVVPSIYQVLGSKKQADPIAAYNDLREALAARKVKHQICWSVWGILRDFKCLSEAPNSSWTCLRDCKGDLLIFLYRIRLLFGDDGFFQVS